MSVIIFLIIVITILQLIVCHVSLWWIIGLVCRCLFCCRIIGATFKVKNLAIGEAVAFGSMLLFNILFSKDGMPWLRLLAFLLMSAGVVILEYLDDILYVYVIEDDE